jgi:peptidoglycan/xylan/chitin deacetylase (PgdA/CDA1 family)
VFVATAYIGSPDPFPFDRWGRRHTETCPASAWRPLDWSACRELQASGVFEVGTHTHTHGDFRSRPADLEQDVRRSLDLLCDNLGPGPRAFAFPFGTVRAGFAGPELAAAVRRTGATCALTTEIALVDPASDPFEWGRLEAVETDTASVCAAKLAGWYNWMGTARNFFQRVSR